MVSARLLEGKARNKQRVAHELRLLLFEQRSSSRRGELTCFTTFLYTTAIRVLFCRRVIMSCNVQCWFVAINRIVFFFFYIFIVVYLNL